MSAINVVRKFFPQVRKVVDSTRNAVIEVTPKDTRSKGIKNHTSCALAVACKRKFDLDGVIISRSIAYLIKDNIAQRFLVPNSVARELVSFDRGAGFVPGDYALSAVPKCIKLGHKTGTAKDSRKRTTRKQFRHLTVKVRAVLGGQQPTT